LTRVDGPAKFANRLSAAAARRSAALGYQLQNLVGKCPAYVFDFALSIVSSSHCGGLKDLHFTSAVLLKPRMIFVIPFCSFHLGFRCTHTALDQHSHEVINVAFAGISIRFSDFYRSA